MHNYHRAEAPQANMTWKMRNKCTLHWTHIGDRTVFFLLSPSRSLLFYVCSSAMYSSQSVSVFFLSPSINKNKLPIEMRCNGVIVCNYYRLKWHYRAVSRANQVNICMYTSFAVQCISQTHIPHSLTHFNAFGLQKIILNEHFTASFNFMCTPLPPLSHGLLF